MGPANPYIGSVRVSTRGDYACRALLSLALRQDDGGPTSVRDIAERTGLTHGSVRVNLHRGVALLRDRLGGGGSRG